MINRNQSRCISLFILIGCLFVWPVLIIPQTPQETAPTGTVTGLVTIDGQPAASIPVMVSRCDGELREFNPAPFKIGTSDTSGNYKIEGLPPGRYCFNPSAPGLIFTIRPGSLEDEFTIAKGETVTGINVSLKKGGVITGRIIDVDGQPVIGIGVVADRIEPKDYQGPSYSKGGQTDDQGVYRIYGVEPGRFKVSTGDTRLNGGKAALGRKTYAHVFYDSEKGATDQSKAAPVEVIAGHESTNINFTVDRILRSFSISGRVIEEGTNRPLAGVKIQCGMLLNGGKTLSPITSFYGLEVNENGEFSIDGLVPGQYGVQVMTDSANYYSEISTFEVKAGDVSNLQLRAKQALSIAGTIILDGVDDPAVKAQLSNLSLEVYVYPPNAGGGATHSSNAIISADGAFQMNSLPPGNVRLFLSRNADKLGFRLIRIERNGVALQSNFAIRPGEAISDLRVIVGYGNGIIQGKVQITGGEIPEGFRLYAYLRPQPPLPITPPYNTFGYVDSRGQFTLKNILPGKYLFWIEGGPAPGSPPADIYVQSQKQPVEITYGTNLSLDITARVTPVKR